ncbi:hypothetical protein [Paracoccus hibiscisoli]|uniref:Uncharacterized protein n=1 Tax=Paracoccus hibiscisoli TaxID=2023261 RepID=A0A4V6WIJ8_9RHOB|nr:hypothetical protein [Paracoccus hibiscisoli]TJZ84868.1 hypothetical protein FA740_07870 [Paracoccus hibiscisoli]
MTILLPRLTPMGVDKCIEDLRNAAPFRSDLSINVEDRLRSHEAYIWYGASGGSVNTNLLEAITIEIGRIARGQAFPSPASERQKTAFDQEVAKFLGAHPDLGGGEALRDDVWACMTCVLLREFAQWRFSSDQKARFAGGVRNTFQRAWMRGRTLDLGKKAPERWQLISSLSEDAMVQIFERASIASDARLARALGIAWVGTSKKLGRGRMEDVMRRAIKLLRLRNQVVDFAFLSDADLSREMSTIFKQVSGAAMPGDSGSADLDQPMISRITRAIFRARKGGTALPT